MQDDFGEGIPEPAFIGGYNVHVCYKYYKWHIIIIVKEHIIALS